MCETNFCLAIDWSEHRFPVEGRHAVNKMAFALILSLRIGRDLFAQPNLSFACVQVSGNVR